MMRLSKGKACAILIILLIMLVLDGFALGVIFTFHQYRSKLQYRLTTQEVHEVIQKTVKTMVDPEQRYN